MVCDLKALGIRTYISEPERAPQSWTDQEAERDAVYANRRRIRGDRGKRLLRRRGELLERPCAHLYETGGLRRAHVRGHENVLKRLLVHASAFNLGLWMRSLFGIGTPRALQGRMAMFVTVLNTLWVLYMTRSSFHSIRARCQCRRDDPRTSSPVARENVTCATGC